MSDARYSVGTYDWDRGAYTPQKGMRVPWLNVSWTGLRAALKDLQRLGYETGRDSAGGNQILVERTDGKSIEEILGGWLR